MPYRYLDHEADIGLEGLGGTVEEALAGGVQGLLDLLVDTTTVRPLESTRVTVTAADLGALFVALLNAVIAEQDIAGCFFHSFRLDGLARHDADWQAWGTLVGEPIDLSRHAVGNEVKAATYAGLLVRDEPGAVSLRCVLDL
ncbi:MAG TPA: archease [Thermomicrobiaceae bacterium]|nr:archease [Thermomicrobiaceae bacterium]